MTNEYDMADLDELSARLGDLEDDGRYRVERTIKSSACETTQLVYRTGERETGPFVRKIFAADSGCGRAYFNIYQAQARGARFAHQPFMYDCFEDDERISVVMEYVQGETLVQLVQREGPCAALAVRVGIMLCEALSELHEGFDPPIIHRDVKPSNIIMAGNRLVLMDLGIAREVRSNAQRDTMQLGTPGYAPPEQFGYGQTDERSDIYAAGMVMAFCLTGCSDNEQLRRSGFALEGISSSLRDVLVRATEFDPRMRYASAREMAMQLSHLQPPISYSASSAGNHAHQVPAREALTEVNVVHQAFPEQPSAERAPGSETRGKTSRPRSCLGYVWNALLAVVFLSIVALSIMAIISPTSSLVEYAPWFRVLAYALIIWVPCGLAGYFLMYKGSLREQFGLLSRLNWKIELVFCVLLSFASILMAVVIGVVTGQVGS